MASETRRRRRVALVGARGWLGVTEPPTVSPRVGGFLLASRLVDPVAQPRWSAHRRRPHVVHRPAFLTVPELDDEDRLAAAVVHPDDSHRGASCQGQGLCWGRSSWRGTRITISSIRLTGPAAGSRPLPAGSYSHDPVETMSPTGRTGPSRPPQRGWTRHQTVRR